MPYQSNLPFFSAQLSMPIYYRMSLAWLKWRLQCFACKFKFGAKKNQEYLNNQTSFPIVKPTTAEVKTSIIKLSVGKFKKSSVSFSFLHNFIPFFNYAKRNYNAVC